MREMKDSGVEWIGEIPYNWTLEKLQWYLDEVNISNANQELKRVLKNSAT